MPRARRRQAPPSVTPIEVTTTTPEKKTEKKQRVLTFVQSQDEVETLLGLKKAVPVTETTETTETTEPTELTEVVTV